MAVESDDSANIGQQRSGTDGVLWRGWLVVFGGFLVHLTVGNMYTVGNMTTYLTSYIRARVDPNFTYEEASWIYTATMMGRGVFTTLGGFVERRFGPRTAAILGCSVATVGVSLTTYTVDVSPWAAILTYGALFGVGTGFAFIAPVACCVRWFPERKGLATGIVVSGIGLGAFTFTQVQTSVLNPENKAVDRETGYFTNEEILQRVPWVFLLLGLVFAVLQICGCVLLTNPPPSPDELAEGKSLFLEENKVKPTDMQLLQIQPNHPGNEEVEVVLAQSMENVVDKGPSEPCESVGKEACTISSIELLPQPSSPLSNKEVQVIISEDKLLLGNECSGNVEGSSGSTRPKGDQGLCPMEVLQTREFYMLWFTFLCNQQAIGYITTMYKAFGQTFIQNDQFLAAVGSVSSIFNTLGRLFWGAVADKTCFRTAILSMTACLAILLATFGATKYGGEAMYSIWVIAIFFVFSGTFTLLPSATCQTFGQNYFGPNYGLVFTSAVAGPPLQSLMAQNLTGLLGTMGLLLLTAGFAVVSFMIMIFYDKTPGPQKICDRWDQQRRKRSCAPL